MSFIKRGDAEILGVVKSDDLTDDQKKTTKKLSQVDTQSDQTLDPDSLQKKLGN